jgi:hypothetical protein
MLLGAVSGSFGEAIGYAVAVVIYSNTFPRALLRLILDDTEADYTAIHLGGSTAQAVYPLGSAAGSAINHVWTKSRKYECITAGNC